jgi:peptidoglycan-N-acetylglucosamine deacetylase
MLILMVVMITDNYTEVSVWAYVVIAIAYLAIQAYGSIVLSAAFYVDVKSSGSRNSNEVALTFDDGPVAGKTDTILEILARYNVAAAFFCIGKNIKEHPGLLRRIHDNGHLVGNHSYWHGKLFDLQTASAIRKELDDTNEVIFQTVGLRPQFFRPPYGVTNPMVAGAIRTGGFKTIGWSLRSLDSVIEDSKALFDKVTRKLSGGDILLFHDFSDSTIEMLPSLIEHIQKRGLKIVRVDQLLNEKAYA